MIVELAQPCEDHPDLSVGQPYVVIGIEADDLRIINDEGRPYLYAAELFRVTDHSEPSDWVAETGDDGERYAYPPPLNQPGFFEDFFDSKPDAVATFWRIVNRNLALAG